MDNLTEIYPFGKISKNNTFDAAILALPYEGQWFHLPKNKLSATEIKLLQQLYPVTAELAEPQNQWYKILFQNAPVEESGSYRIIQLHLHSMPDYSKNDWQTSLTEMLQPTDCFFIQANVMIIVDKYSKHTFSLEDLKGILATLDADFDATTKAFVGNFFSSSENFTLIFHEEEHIFNTEAKRFVKENFLTLPQVALDFLTEKTIADNALMQIFKRELLKDDELQEIIRALWDNQGNLSSAAKQLFMHRNTLTYRLEKLHEQSGFQLKNSEDLTLCYMLIQH